MIYQLKPGKILKLALALSLLTFAVGLTASLSWRFGIRNTLTFYLRQFFALSTETAIPTWFSSVLLFLCATLLFCIWCIKANIKARYRYHWLGLSTVFLLFSIDEVAAIHEKLGKQIVGNFVSETGGLFYYSWVISGIVFVAIFGLAYLKFLRDLPEQTRWLFLLSAGLFISGALGAEMLSAQQYEQSGWSLAHILWYSIEEGLEMCGTSLFLYSILKYIDAFIGPMKISIEPSSKVVPDINLDGQPATEAIEAEQTLGQQ